MPRRQTPESNILNAICEFLTHKKYVVIRVNNFPAYDVKTKSHRALPKYAVKGMSDLIVLKNGVVTFIEVKSLKGKLSENQLKFEKMIEEAGGNYIVATSIDDVIYRMR